MRKVSEMSLEATAHRAPRPSVAVGSHQVVAASMLPALPTHSFKSDNDDHNSNSNSNSHTNTNNLQW